MYPEASLRFTLGFYGCVLAVIVSSNETRFLFQPDALIALSREKTQKLGGSISHAGLIISGLRYIFFFASYTRTVSFTMQSILTMYVRRFIMLRSVGCLVVYPRV